MTLRVVCARAWVSKSIPCHVHVCGSMGILLISISMSCILLISNLLYVSTRERCARWVVCSLVRVCAVLLPCCALPVGRSRSRHDGSHRRAFFLKVRVKVDHIPAHFQASQAYRLIFISLPCGHFLFPARGYLDPQIW